MLIVAVAAGLAVVAFRFSRVTLWDVGVERQIEISGPDAFTFANMMSPRDLAKCGACPILRGYPPWPWVGEARQHPETAPTR